jgi:hypothetical protein
LSCLAEAEGVKVPGLEGGKEKLLSIEAPLSELVKYAAQEA